MPPLTGTDEGVLPRCVRSRGSDCGHDRDAARNGLSQSRYLSVEHQLSPERRDESPDNHYDDFHAADLYCRYLWDEFRAHAGIEVGMGLSAGTRRDGGNRDRHARIFHTEEVDLTVWLGRHASCSPPLNPNRQQSDVIMPLATRLRAGVTGWRT